MTDGHDPDGRPGDAGPAALWMDAFGEAADVVAHHLKNLLNGVAVNLEVARARSARGAEGSAIAPFAATAAERFEAASAAADALLALSRPEPEPADVARVAARVAALLAGADGRASIAVLAQDGEGDPRTAAPAPVVRAAVLRTLLAASAAPGAVTCQTRCREGIFLRVARDDGAAAPLDPRLERSLSEFGVRARTTAGALELQFPALSR